MGGRRHLAFAHREPFVHLAQAPPSRGVDGTAPCRIVLLPVFLLLAGLLVYLVGFLLEMLQIDAGRSLVAGYASWLQVAFAPKTFQRQSRASRP